MLLVSGARGHPSYEGRPGCANERNGHTQINTAWIGSQDAWYTSCYSLTFYRAPCRDHEWQRNKRSHMLARPFLLRVLAMLFNMLWGTKHLPPPQVDLTPRGHMLCTLSYHAHACHHLFFSRADRSPEHSRRAGGGVSSDRPQPRRHHRRRRA